MKVHWIRKSFYCDSAWNNYYGYPDDKKIAFYDLTTACGIDIILNSTVMRHRVTCKNCLRVINAKRYNTKSNRV